LHKFQCGALGSAALLTLDIVLSLFGCTLDNLNLARSEIKLNCISFIQQVAFPVGIEWASGLMHWSWWLFSRSQHERQFSWDL